MSQQTPAVTKPEQEVTRRSFFLALFGIGSVGMGALLAVPVLRYVLYPLTAQRGSAGWSVVGNISDLKAELASGQPVRRTIDFQQMDGWRQEDSAQSVYVTHAGDGKLRVLSAICPHLGCSVSWQKTQDEFVCPCHGGRFSATGRHLSGPPPRGMDSLQYKVEGGRLLVRFQYFRSNVPNKEPLT